MSGHGMLTWLVTYAVHSTILLSAVWMVTRWVRHPLLNDVLWKLAIVGSLATATAPSLGIRGGGRSVAITTAAVGPVERLATTPSVIAAEVVSGGSAVSRIQPERGPAPSVASKWSAADLAAAAWAVVAGWLVLGFAFRRWQLARRLGTRRIVASHPAVAEIAELRRLAGVRRTIVLTASDRLASPIAVGLGEVSVPERALVELDGPERRSMLAHELAHLIRFDPTWLAGTALIERVFFFQPLNRVARRRIQSAAELICDRWSAERTGSPLTLASCLVRVAEWIDAAPRPIPIAGMAEERSELVDRVRHLVEEGPMRSPVRRGWLVAAGLTALVGLVAFAPRISLVGQAPATDRIRPSRVDLADPTPVLAPVGGVAGLARVRGDRGPAQDTTGAVVPALIAALKDPSAHVRQAAAQSLGNLEDRRATMGLISLLDDDDADVKVAAVQALAQLEDPRSASALSARLADPVREVRRMAIQALANMKEAVGPEVFRDALADEDAETRRAALHALSERDDKGSTPMIVGLVADRDAEVRRAALHALGELKDPKAVDAIVGALRDPNDEVRQAAIHALASLELEQLPAGALEALSDEDAEVRQAAAWMAGGAGDRRAVPELRRLLLDRVADVREAAVQALGQIRDAAAIDALVVALKSADPVVRRAAAEALGERKEH